MPPLPFVVANVFLGFFGSKLEYIVIAKSSLFHMSINFLASFCFTTVYELSCEKGTEAVSTSFRCKMTIFLVKAPQNKSSDNQKFTARYFFCGIKSLVVILTIPSKKTVCGKFLAVNFYWTFCGDFISQMAILQRKDFEIVAVPCVKLVKRKLIFFLWQCTVVINPNNIWQYLTNHPFVQFRKHILTLF